MQCVNDASLFIPANLGLIPVPISAVWYLPDSTSSVQNALFGNIPPQFRADMAAILNQLSQQVPPHNSGDVPVSDERAGPSKGVESQSEAAVPEVELPVRVSMDTNEIDAARLSVLLNAVAGMVGGGAGGGVHEAPVVSLGIR